MHKKQCSRFPHLKIEILKQPQRKNDETKVLDYEKLCGFLVFDIIHAKKIVFEFLTLDKLRNFVEG